MKTDAVVLLELIDELRTKHPASDKTTYTVLAAFQKGTKEINVTSFINECCGRLREFIEIIPDTTEVHRNSFFFSSQKF
jgi:hypothetical protein